MTLQDDYNTIREGAAIGAISPRALLAVAGADRASYLQGLLTNDIQTLTPGTGCYSAWLTPQGRMLTDMHVLQSENMILLDVPADTAAATLERLDQFLFSEDVQIESLAAIVSVWLHGPGAAAAIERVLHGVQNVAGWPAYRHARADFGGTGVSLVRIDQLGVPGYCVYVEPARERALVGALESAGARRVGREALEAARIEAGYPVFGIDMTGETIPLEAGIEDRAISLTKGCYVGQEIIIRVLHRGGGRVAKKLVALRIEDQSGAGLDGPAKAGHCAAGAKLFSDDREIGEVTSAAASPRLGIIALAYVHRDFAVPATAIQVEARGNRLPAVVTSRPIPSS